jgi:cell division protease FtsH
MVMRYGMDDALGHVAYEHRPAGLLPVPDALAVEPRQYSETTAHEIDDAVRRLVGAAFDHATLLLEDNKALLEEGSNRLLARETLDEADLAQLAQWAPAPKPAEALA